MFFSLPLRVCISLDISFSLNILSIKRVEHAESNIFIISNIKIKYRVGVGDGQKLIEKIRNGNLEQWDKYWIGEESSICVL